MVENGVGAIVPPNILGVEWRKLGALRDSAHAIAADLRLEYVNFWDPLVLGYGRCTTSAIVGNLTFGAVTDILMSPRAVHSNSVDFPVTNELNEPDCVRLIKHLWLNYRGNEITMVCLKIL